MALVRIHHYNIDQEKSEPLPAWHSRRRTSVHPPKDGFVQFTYLQLQERIAAAINDLPEQERLIVTLFYYEELSLVQIGIVIGESDARASQIYASALVNLRSRLQDPFGQWQPTIHTTARPPTNGLGLVKKRVPPAELE